jgi:nicotinate-nucleotide pyrophosphorylase (carboxylating)
VLRVGKMDWDSEYITDLVNRALEEDVATGDVTTIATIPDGATGKARIIARGALVCAGLPLVEKVVQALDPEMDVEFLARDGDAVAAGTELVRISGSGQAILTGERTVLNFLGHLSGIATLTQQIVKELEGTSTRIRDTRKTTPGLRLLEKYAVRMGGGVNHRIGLFDAILLKENHIALAGGIKAALDKAHTFASSRLTSKEITAYEANGNSGGTLGGAALPIQIEVRNESELREALGAGAESVLLDNMTPEEAAVCVRMAREIRKDCVVEISGGITPENARAYGAAGADFLSSGLLTHSAPAANLSLLVDSIQES